MNPANLVTHAPKMNGWWTNPLRNRQNGNFTNSELEMVAIVRLNIFLQVQEKYLDSPNGLVIAIHGDRNWVERNGTRSFWTLFKCSPFPYLPKHDVRFPYIWIKENIVFFCKLPVEFGVNGIIHPRSVSMVHEKKKNSPSKLRRFQIWEIDHHFQVFTKTFLEGNVSSQPSPDQGSVPASFFWWGWNRIPSGCLKTTSKFPAKKKPRWWFQRFFLFTPIWGKISNLPNIFQRGWFNHQPVPTGRDPLPPFHRLGPCRRGGPFRKAA